MVLGNGVLLKGDGCILEVPMIKVSRYSGTSDSGLSQTRHSIINLSIHKRQDLRSQNSSPYSFYTFLTSQRTAYVLTKNVWSCPKVSFIPIDFTMISMPRSPNFPIKLNVLRRIVLLLHISSLKVNYMIQSGIPRIREGSSAMGC